MKKFWVFGAVLLLCIAGLTGSAAAVPVALELALLVDVSGSVDSSEFNLMKTGYVNAFNNAEVQAKIAALPQGMAVTFIYWSGATQQQQAVGWTLLDSAADASAFASAINSTTRPYSGQTAIGSAINYAYPKFSNNGYEGTCLFIDVSGDGVVNDGATIASAKAAALAALGSLGAINGLPVGNTTIQTYYANNVIGGYEAFYEPAINYSVFGDSILKKINTELDTAAAVPVPASVLLLGSGLMGLVFWRRQRG